MKGEDEVKIKIISSLKKNSNNEATWSWDLTGGWVAMLSIDEFGGMERSGFKWEREKPKLVD